MTKNSLLITNARLVNDGHVTEGDLRVQDGRIEAIASSLQAGDSETVLDAAGRHLLPGFIDDQVHFREPGLTHKGDMATESAAAVAGATALAGPKGQRRGSATKPSECGVSGPAGQPDPPRVK